MKEERCTGLVTENPLKALWNAIAVKTEEPDDVAPKKNRETDTRGVLEREEHNEKTKLPRGHHVKYDRAFQDRAREGQEHWNKTLKSMREEWKKREIGQRFAVLGSQMTQANRAMVKAQKVCVCFVLVCVMYLSLGV